MTARRDPEILGIHHITAIAGDPQHNVDFYTGVLGLRLVKRTVNYDAPETYHLYFGDELGRPGTVLTFFPWPESPRGRHGTGQATAIAFSVPPESLGHWVDRLRSGGVAAERIANAFEEPIVTFADPDGLPLELVADPDADLGHPWEAGPVPAPQAIRGFHSVALLEHAYRETDALLTGVLGWRLHQHVGHRRRYVMGPGGLATRVDVVEAPDAPRGSVAVGTVHHVAWRTPDDDTQRAWRERIVKEKISVTPVMDRQYFHSIYFREPGGVLFEIATDGPGFTVDEPPEALGTGLRLPRWLESERAAIESILPALRAPSVFRIL